LIRGAAGGTAALLSIGNNTTAAQFTVNSIGVAAGNGAGLTSVTATVVVTPNSSLISNASGLYAVTGYYDLKEMFGWVGDGVTNNDLAWANTRTWGTTIQPNNQSLPVSLLIPPGTYHISGSMVWPSFLCDGGSTPGTQGIRNSVIHAYGAKFDRTMLGGTFNTVGTTGTATGAFFANGKVGDTSITLITHANASVFTPGNWMCLAAMETMGYGYPPNPYYFEYQQILSSNSSTGVIVLGDSFNNISTPLRNSYLSTYPAYANGMNGPAYAYCMDPSWGTETEWHGLAVDQGNNQVYGSQKKLTFINCRFVSSSAGSQGYAPSATKELKMIGGKNGDMLVEVDKCVELAEFKNIEMKQVLFQSSTTQKCLIDGCSIPQGINGTPKNIIVRDTDAGLFKFGPNYGATETVLVENSRLGSIGYNGATGCTLASITSITNGVIKIVNGNQSGANPIPFLMPGSKGFFSNYQNGVDNYGLPFAVLSITADSSYTYYQTTLPAVLPTWNTTPYSNPDRIVPHPCQSVTFINVSGCPQATWMSSAPPARPAFEYSKLTYFGSMPQNGTNLLRGYNWGNLSKLTINVRKAYSGATSPAVANVAGIVTTSSYTANYYYVNIDLTQAGLRTITPTTINGALGNDVLGSAPGNIWFTGNWGLAGFSGVDLSADTITHQPIWELELYTDQGITAFDVISGYTSALPY